MNEKLVIRLDGEYSLYLGKAAQDVSTNPAVERLETEFTDQWVNRSFLLTGIPGPNCIRPMFEIMDQRISADIDEEPAATAVRQSDYDDSGRWWL